jgi:hypothetical protein
MSLVVGLACGLVSVAFLGGEARADILQLTISEGPVSYVILDEGPLDTLVAPPPSNINHIQALAAALVFPDYKVIGLSAATNNPGSAEGFLGTTLTVSGEVQRLTGGGTPSLIISATDTDYSFPGFPRILLSSMSTTFTNAPPPLSSTRTFTSWYNPTNTPYATDVPQGSPVPLTYLSTGYPPNSNGANAAVVGVPFAPLYGLTSRTVITMSTITSAAPADVSFAGSTTVTILPEPASLLLLTLLGVPVVGWIVLRPRRV